MCKDSHSLHSILFANDARSSSSALHTSRSLGDRELGASSTLLEAASRTTRACVALRRRGHERWVDQLPTHATRSKSAPTRSHRPSPTRAHIPSCSRRCTPERREWAHRRRLHRAIVLAIATVVVAASATSPSHRVRVVGIQAAGLTTPESRLESAGTPPVSAAEHRHKPRFPGAWRSDGARSIRRRSLAQPPRS